MKSLICILLLDDPAARIRRRNVSFERSCCESEWWSHKQSAEKGASSFVQRRGSLDQWRLSDYGPIHAAGLDGLDLSALAGLDCGFLDCDRSSAVGLLPATCYQTARKILWRFELTSSLAAWTQAIQGDQLQWGRSFQMGDSDTESVRKTEADQG